MNVVLRVSRGFTLVEVLIAMAVGALLLAGLFSVYVNQKKVYTLREQIAEMQQNARAGMALLGREIRMAGYDPQKTAGAGIVIARQDCLRFTMDLDESGAIDDPAHEDITYRVDADRELGRYTGANNCDQDGQPLVEHIQSLRFCYFLEGNLSTCTPTPTSAQRDQIRMIEVTLTAQTSAPDPAYPEHNGYRQYALRSLITPRNLGY